METCTDNTTVITTLLASGLFIVSEMLPFLSNIKGNGIIEAVSEAIANYLKKKKELPNLA